MTKRNEHARGKHALNQHKQAKTLSAAFCTLPSQQSRSSCFLFPWLFIYASFYVAAEEPKTTFPTVPNFNDKKFPRNLHHVRRRHCVAVAAMLKVSSVAAEEKAHQAPSQEQGRLKSSEESTNDQASDRHKRFGDCALVEIIHLHDCLRGALHAWEKDINELSEIVLGGNFDGAGGGGEEKKDDNGSGGKEAGLGILFADGAHLFSEALSSSIPPATNKRERLVELESRANARFQVIWSVFRAHSAAEDEFIWPALRLKTQGMIKGSPCNSPCYQSGQVPDSGAIAAGSGYESETVEQEEYEEDHADEERMFTMMDHLLRRMRKGLNYENEGKKHNRNTRDNFINTMKEIVSLTKTLKQHLMVHLEKEENQCMPLVVKHMTKSEIHDLVGQIMGKRSSDMIAQILAMAVQNLDAADQEGMVKHMKQAMAGTFFDQWLSMSGWMDGGKKVRSSSIGTGDEALSPDSQTAVIAAAVAARNSPPVAKRLKMDTSNESQPSASVEPQPPTLPLPACGSAAASNPLSPNMGTPAGEITSQAELEKLIRAVITNQGLTPVEKQKTIQGLRASVWKRNQRLLTGNGDDVDNASGSASSANVPVAPDLRAPAAYYVSGEADQIYCVEDPDLIPKFTTEELAPTYNNASSTGKVQGCPHYARACKLRHPISGHLHTCRICCEQKREAGSAKGEVEPPLDRYAVQEVLCMACTTLQPAGKHCIKPDCELHTKTEGFARYYCDICHLYDDRPRPVFHCPYCNTCRLGKGLGIDFRHCMRCNACVAIDEEHRCIPQKLQGSCPICHETLFNSTEPLRGLQCGHVMHLSCFNDYRREQNYTCPLCMRCMEDMSDYFSLLDQAVAMQPMPLNLRNTLSNIYCQDCEQTGQCRFHFVGLKCPTCGSYNTREMGRVQATTITEQTNSDNL